MGQRNVGPISLYDGLVERAWIMVAVKYVHDLLLCREVEIPWDAVLEGCGGERVVQLHLLIVGEEGDGVQPAAHKGVAYTHGIDYVEDIHDGRLQQFAIRPEQSCQGVVL